MALIGERTKTLPIIMKKSKVHCTLFEKKNICIELVKFLRMIPRTKRIVLTYHHFRSNIKEGLISVKRVDTKMKHGDLLTKALA